MPSKKEDMGLVRRNCKKYKQRKAAASLLKKKRGEKRKQEPPRGRVAHRDLVKMQTCPEDIIP